MSRRQAPKRRVLLVMYGVTVARSTRSTSHPSSMRPLATFVMSTAVCGTPGSGTGRQETDGRAEVSLCSTVVQLTSM